VASRDDVGGPFEFYVWLDSDAVVGDLEVHTDVDSQIFWDDTPIGPEEIPEWFLFLLQS
jgi:hypothetical protein